MNYPRPLTELHIIELSSKCNLRCTYCPHPKMARAKIDMTWPVFERCLYWCKTLVDQGTQHEVSVHGLGESTLHPDFVRMLYRTREVLPHTTIQFSTNGLIATDEIVKACKDIGARVFISLHRPEKAGLAVKKYKDAGVPLYAHANFAVSAFNWAGQVNWITTAAKSECQYLKLGRGVALADGSITTCCIDVEKDGVIGNVYDEPGTVFMRPYKLCDTCDHMTVP